MSCRVARRHGGGPSRGPSRPVRACGPGFRWLRLPNQRRRVAGRRGATGVRRCQAVRESRDGPGRFRVGLSRLVAGRPGGAAAAGGGGGAACRMRREDASVEILRKNRWFRSPSSFDQVLILSVRVCHCRVNSQCPSNRLMGHNLKSVSRPGSVPNRQIGRNLKIGSGKQARPPPAVVWTGCGSTARAHMFWGYEKPAENSQAQVFYFL